MDWGHFACTSDSILAQGDDILISDDFVVFFQCFSSKCT